VSPAVSSTTGPQTVTADPTATGPAAGQATASAALRAAGHAAWAAAVGHPMVRAIAAGTLPHETFRGYFEQNVRYLEDYARAIALTTAKAPDRPALDVLSRFLRQIVATEIPANLAFLGRLGGSAGRLPGLAELHPVTYGYTRHLLHVCEGGSCAEGLAALLPCQWSYGEIAQPLMAAPPDDPVYADWVRMFGNAGYDALVAETTGLLDRLAGPVVGDPVVGDPVVGDPVVGDPVVGDPVVDDTAVDDTAADDTAADDTADAGPWARLSAVFSISVRYEGEFWDMAYAAA
jgi:thiaminase (transcriptional activator TenA)